MRDISGGLGEPVLTQEDLVEWVLPYEAFDFWQRLVPIEVRVVHQEVAWPSHAEHIQEWKIIWIGPHGCGQGSAREADGHPFTHARATPIRALQRIQHAGQRSEQKN